LAIDIRPASYNSSSTVMGCDSYTLNGNTYIASTTIVDTLTTAGGGTHVMTVNLTMNSSTSSTETITTCDSLIWNGNVYKTSGTYQSTISNVAGCDSAMTLILTVNTADVTVISNDPTLTSNAIGAVYQWVDCDNSNAPISGETNQSYVATGNGNFAVMVTENGCTTTSACYTILSIGILENVGGVFKVHPNPSSSVLYIDVQEEIGSYDILITDIAGRQVYNTNLNQPAISAVNIEDWPNGMYLLFVNSDKGRTSHKIIKY